MRRHTSWLLAALLAGCAAGEDGPVGIEGARGSGGSACTATLDAAGWTVTCEDGTSAVLPPASCETLENGDGSTTVRCPDGTEAVVVPTETIAAGSVIGTVELRPGVAASGAVIEVVGTGRSAMADGAGAFRVQQVPMGTWTIRATLPPWNEAVLEDVVVLPGTFDAGTITLTLGVQLPAAEGSFNPDGQALLYRMDGDFALLDLVDGSVQPLLLPEMDDAMWIDAGSILLEDDDEGVMAIHVRALGQTSYHYDVTWFEARPGGVLAVRRDDLGAERLWLLWPQRDVELGPADGSFAALHGALPLWAVTNADGLFVVDGRLMDPSLARLDARTPIVEPTADPSGQLVFARFADENRLFRLGDRSIVVDAESVIFGDGFARWVTSTGEAIGYHAATGTGRSMAPGMVHRWVEPSYRWLLYQTGAIWVLESTANPSVMHELDAPPDAFSPEAGRAAWLRGPSLIELRDFTSGESKQITIESVDFTGALLEFLDEEWLQIESGGERHVLGWSGRFFGLGADIGGVGVANGHLLLTRSGQDELWSLSTGSVHELGREASLFSPDGRRVVWESAATGALRVKDLETGAVHRIADRADGFLPLADVVLYLGSGHAGTGLYSAPYP